MEQHETAAARAPGEARDDRPKESLSRVLSPALLIFLASTFTMAAELVHARILAFQFWQHLVYYVLTMGFLGFAASGTYLSVSRRVARAESRVLAILGSGVQAGAHLAALNRVRNFDDVRVWSRTPERARRFAFEHGAVAAEDVRAAVEDAADQERAAEARSREVKREMTARLFAEPFWPASRALGWIAFRDPQLIEKSWTAAKLYESSELGRALRDRNPSTSLLRALQVWWP